MAGSVRSQRAVGKRQLASAPVVRARRATVSQVPEAPADNGRMRTPSPRLARLAARTALLVVLIAMPFLAAGCRHGRPAPGWDQEWAALRRLPPPYGVGSEFVVAVHDRTPDGPRTRRFRYVLREIRDSDGVFDCTGADGITRPATHRLHPAVPRVPRYGSQGRRGIYPYAEPLREVRVPAGTFRCGRTWTTRERNGGLVMRVDEWWSPNLPFAVQRWERAEQDVDRGLRTPPATPDSLPAGTEWSVLESVSLR